MTHEAYTHGYSDCCGARIYNDIMICCKCKGHCENKLLYMDIVEKKSNKKDKNVFVSSKTQTYF